MPTRPRLARIPVLIAIINLSFVLGCTTYYAPNWSGYIANYTGARWTGVSGSFTQADFHQDFNQQIPQCIVNQEASWVGLGGHNGSLQLVQAGTEMKQSPSGAGYVDEIDAIYELADGPMSTGIRTLPGVHVYVGDKIDTSVFFSPTDGLIHVTVTDENSNSSGTASQAIAYDGSTAEWIDEPPYIGNTETPFGMAFLTNFDHIDWDNLLVWNLNANGEQDLFTLSGTYNGSTSAWHDLSQNNAHPTPPVLALPYGPSSSNPSDNKFTDRFNHCGYVPQ